MSDPESDTLLIQLDSVSRSYGYGETESFALKDFSLEVKRGEFIMIMGPSGCGKTTLLNIIGLLDKPTSGQYFLNGESVESLSSHRKSNIRSQKVGYIFQDFNLIANLTVIENVALPLIYSGAGKTKRLKTASNMLGTLHLNEREYYYPYQLSGGQQQRVCIARSLVNHPEIILADEPTGNLDSRSAHIVMEELRNIHNEGNTIIMVTHNPDLTTYATRVIHMLDGQIDADIKTVADDDLPQISEALYDEEPEEIEEEITEADEENISQYDINDEEPEILPLGVEENISVDISQSDVKDEEAGAETETEGVETPVQAPVEEAPKADLGELIDEPVPIKLPPRPKNATRSIAKTAVKKSSFPIVGSTYVDKSVRAAAKPTMEDLVKSKPTKRRRK